MQLSRDLLLRHVRLYLLLSIAILEEVEFAAIVDQSDGIDRAEANLERTARFEMKSGKGSRAGSAWDPVELSLFSR